MAIYNTMANCFIRIFCWHCLCQTTLFLLPCFNQIMTKQFLNTRRLLCPLPVIRTQDKVKQMQAGEVLEVVGTDPGILQDIPAWCRINGHQVLSTESAEFEYTVIFKVGV